ncbi:hypothetical protein [Streptomyces sp. TLI_146]|uniref:hypothetical protein n=1 Tax=Streptomyces sp. TLI_146 TaxID=1938858 RepID=UPI00117E323E|nr:hypothetical protein [Streptomyces sp. TLI_146]
MTCIPQVSSAFFSPASVAQPSNVFAAATVASLAQSPAFFVFGSKSVSMSLAAVVCRPAFELRS